MGALLGIVALLAAIALGVRALRRRARARAQPGRRREQPIAIRDYGEIDLTVRLQHCACGGRYGVRGEGPADDGVRVVHVECQRCERDVALYFDVRGVLH